MLDDERTFEQIKHHYVIEKELSNKLRTASKEDRCHLYTSLYDEFYERVPIQPQLINKASAEKSTNAVSSQMGFLRRFLKNHKIFMEIGPGDCALSFMVSNHVTKIYAVDVSREITKNVNAPENFELILSNGTSIPLPNNSVDIAYSNQLMEHLHPDDAFEQLENIYNVLIKGGTYICCTPNRLSGPHDVSKYFDKIATGFHSKEYSVAELHNLFKTVGFCKTNLYVGAKGIYIRFPLFLIIFFENILNILPDFFGKKIASMQILRPFLGIRIVGIK